MAWSFHEEAPTAEPTISIGHWARENWSAIVKGPTTYFWEFLKHLLKRSNQDAEQVFNYVEETGFRQSQWTKKVVGRRWSSYMTITACVIASGCVIPSLYLVPSKCLIRDVMDAATEVPGIAVTVAPKGLINSSIFVKWLEHFKDSAPLRVKRPLILIYDDLICITMMRLWQRQLNQK